jgi:peptidoglycan-associated lipoprotein
MSVSRRTLLAAAVLITAACGGSQPEQPVPQTGPVTPTVNADSVRRAQEEAERRRREADSIAAAQRDAAARSAAAAEAAARAEAERAFANQVHFDYDKSEIRADDQGILDWKVRFLQANASMTIRISGHADDRGSDEYNLALGNRRAAAAKRYLVSKGIAESRITTDSFGEERPQDTAANEAAWAANRRAEFTITAGPATWTIPTP